MFLSTPRRKSWPLPGPLESLGMNKMQNNASNGSGWVYTDLNLGCQNGVTCANVG